MLVLRPIALAAALLSALTAGCKSNGDDDGNVAATVRDGTITATIRAAGSIAKECLAVAEGLPAGGTCDGDGRVTIFGVPAGDHAVNYRGTGTLSAFGSIERSVTVGPRENVDLGVIELGLAGSVSGSVIADPGIISASVVQLVGSEEFVRPATNGTYQIKANAGTHQVQLVWPGNSVLRPATFVVEPAKMTQGIDIEVSGAQSTNGTISGKVTEEQGFDGTVTLELWDAVTNQLVTPLSPDGNGNFQESVAPGVYAVFVSTSEGLSFQLVFTVMSGATQIVNIFVPKNSGDFDQDGFDDAVDADDDNDGVLDEDDAFPFDPNEWEDSDGDGIGDNSDPSPNGPPMAGDLDGDGEPDGSDNCQNVYNPGQEDSDLDGVGDACDVCPLGDDTVDLDVNGVPDACDGVGY